MDGASPAATLTDDLLREVLRRVPYSSLCRFKCVSRSWLALCSDLAVRRASPQTISGFFHQTPLMTTPYHPPRHRHHFTNVSGRGGRPMVDPALPFLPAAYDDVELVDCCNGLLLCRCQRPSPQPHGYAIDCVVCNPATGKWTVLPSTEAMEGIYSAYLGFDPAVSPTLHRVSACGVLAVSGG